MANIGEVVKAGQSAPEAGTYQCNAPGCTNTFKASIKGVPLPAAHHPGAAWKLTEKAMAMGAQGMGAPARPATAAPPAKPASPAAPPASKPAAPAAPPASKPGQPGKGTQPGKSAPGSM